ncbi:hypothetical protein AZI86_10705 [Bdellovibrio bacteriovorus]|uniref:Outer membrane protein beta-barrel domain-containing protein n=1 Tax=Bdellovibrio bacteriovorus TaxID=959 RepID=A0A150WLU5_BDEBC|nr:hypothetical protein [Bdellovibrio bacteriovorus]KYG64673.1 hypothetical protein AZI86_10705 [Bdellovibrio bacteriovorus]
MRIFLALLFILSPYAVHAENLQVFSKIVLRTGAGLYENTGTNKGSAVSTGGFNFQYVHFLNDRLAFGFGYMAQFDLNSSGVPISGLELLGRIYLKDRASRVVQKENWGEYIFQRNWNPYVSTLYGKRQFYLGADLESLDPTKSLSGDYNVINIGLGGDLRLNSSFEFNMEVSTSAFSFAGSDPRVQIKENVFWMGLNYVF